VTGEREVLAGGQLAVTRIAGASMRRVPWKNGRGTTLEVASDAGEVSQEWSWRISIADVPESGPFSRFVGVERHILSLVIASGDGMSLLIDGAPPVAVPTAGEALSFDGEAETMGVLHGAPLRDANLMVRREAALGRQRGRMRFVVGEESIDFEPDHAVLAVIAIDASCRVQFDCGGERAVELSPGDALIIERSVDCTRFPPGRISVSSAGRAILCQVLRPASPGCASPSG
jgi:uncharacterized protein